MFSIVTQLMGWDLGPLPPFRIELLNRFMDGRLSFCFDDKIVSTWVESSLCIRYSIDRYRQKGSLGDGKLFHLIWVDRVVWFGPDGMCLLVVFCASQQRIYAAVDQIVPVVGQRIG